MQCVPGPRARCGVSKDWGTYTVLSLAPPKQMEYERSGKELEVLQDKKELLSGAILHKSTLGWQGHCQEHLNAVL